MALKFSANVSMMYKETSSLRERIFKASAFGFKYIEVTAPYVEEKDVLSQTVKDASIQCSLINAWPAGEH